MRIPVFYGMLLLVLLLIYILEARSVALKQGETVANEKIVVCLLSLAITAFFWINWNTGMLRKVLLVDFNQALSQKNLQPRHYYKRYARI